MVRLTPSSCRIEVDGEELWKTLEGVFSRSNIWNNDAVTSSIQVSRNINITYNSNNANGTKLVAIEIGDEPFSNTSTYNIVTVDFIATGTFHSF
jgi:hypothetical protein